MKFILKHLKICLKNHHKLILHPLSHGLVVSLMGSKMELLLKSLETARGRTDQEAVLPVADHFHHVGELGLAPGPRAADWVQPWLMHQLEMSTHVCHVSEAHVARNTSKLTNCLMDNITSLVTMFRNSSILLTACIFSLDVL